MHTYRLDPHAKKHNVEQLLEWNACPICLRLSDLVSYHHLKDKKDNINSMWGGSYANLFFELFKCLPMCFECHGKIHCEDPEKYPNYTSDKIEIKYTEYWKDHLYSLLSESFWLLTDAMGNGETRKRNHILKFPSELISKLKNEPYHIPWLSNILETDDPISFIIELVPRKCLRGLREKRLISWSY
jgi:hypothetical protein